MTIFARFVASLVLFALAACAPMPPGGGAEGKEAAQADDAEEASLMYWDDLTGRVRPAPDETVRYGEDALQVADLWLPKGKGPYPTVLMIHGGCWQTDIADRGLMNWIADDLRNRGYAVWNIEYRGVDRPGGGYPGTYLDVANAAKSLRDNAARYNLNINPLVAIGHSAGGHLALWLAGQNRLPADSPLQTGDPVIPDYVVSQGGLPDLELAATPPGSGCGTEVIGQISGGKLNETSVPRLAPLGVRQVLINGLQDNIIPTGYATDYTEKMRAAGDDARVRFIDKTGHVELIAPETDAWAAAVEEIDKAWRAKKVPLIMDSSERK